VSDGPSLEVVWLSSDATNGDWHVVWEVRNGGAEAITLGAAYAPHQGFRGAERALGTELAPGGRTNVELVVRVQPVDDSAPNPFLALRVTRAGEAWLVLARLAITDRDGRPDARVTRVTAQRSGFSRDTDAQADAGAETRSRKAEGNDKER